MKLKDEKYAAETARAMAMLDKFERGVDVPLEQFETAFGVARADDDELFRRLLRKVEKTLWKERQIRMCCVVIGSQRQLTPAENLTIYQEKMRKKRFRNAGKSLRTLVGTEAASLTIHQQRMRDFAMASLKNERRDNARARNLAKKSEVNPIRRPPAAVAAHTG